MRRLDSVSTEVGAVIRAYVEQLTGPEFELPPGDGLSGQALAALPDEVLREIATLHQRTSWLTEHAGELPFKGEVEEELMVGVLDVGVDLARWWFSQKVRHLGPLRAAPQPFYGLPEAASVASVGKNGEYTAAVLSTFGKQRSLLPLPDGTERQVRLGHAVDEWVKALGLLAAVHPSEGGKYGYELNVSMEGVERPLDLTTVGVGVSQALPIIVLGLIADRGSLLLFEQPELHLHPDVQASLGDFFLALARSGRQLMVETHSEYLINRLRRRQATDSEPDATDLVRLFFFERSGPAAKITPAQIGSDGSMPSWPRGFLDTASREVEAMVMHDRS
jgi:predicted ATPase